MTSHLSWGGSGELGNSSVSVQMEHTITFYCFSTFMKLNAVTWSNYFQVNMAAQRNSEKFRLPRKLELVAGNDVTPELEGKWA